LTFWKSITSVVVVNVSEVLRCLKGLEHSIIVAITFLSISLILTFTIEISHDTLPDARKPCALCILVNLIFQAKGLGVKGAAEFMGKKFKENKASTGIPQILAPNSIVSTNNMVGSKSR